MQTLYVKSNDLAKNYDLLHSRSMKQKIYCIKLGGSVITDKTVPYKAQIETIRAVAKSLKKVKAPLLIAHGSGSFGHTSAKKYGGKNGYTDRWGIAKVSRDAQEINRIVIDILIEEGLPAVSFSPRSFILAKKGIINETYFSPVREALKQGLIPVIYGDVIWDSAQKTTILSGETILNAICQDLQKHNYTIAKIIQLCNVDGVLDDTKKVIPEITKENWKTTKAYIQNLSVADVTGGMFHKVEDALSMANYGVETLLLNGNDSNNLSYAIKGKSVEGTVIR